jgi:hypothetical protein
MHVERDHEQHRIAKLVLEIRTLQSAEPHLESESEP